jgi:hypothetical protein
VIRLVRLYAHKHVNSTALETAINRVVINVHHRAQPNHAQVYVRMYVLEYVAMIVRYLAKSVVMDANQRARHRVKLAA